MKKFLLSLLILFAYSILFCEEKPAVQTDFDLGVIEYASGNLKKAKEHLLKVEWANDAKSRFVDFLLSDIAVKEGNLPLAKERFARAFKNLPEGNELLLAKNFSSFCDINEFYKFEVELLEPFYKTHKDYFNKDSILAWHYAKALFKVGKIDESKQVLENLWNTFSKDEFADGVDEILLNKELSDVLKNHVKNRLNSESQIEKIRAKIIAGDSEKIELIESPSVGLLLWFAKNFKNISEDDFVNALERNPDSVFAWQVWYLLARQSFENEQYELAYNFASKAETLSPDSILDKAKIFILMGDCDRFLKRYKQAKDEYKKVILSKACVGELVAQATYKMGLTCYEEKSWKEAYVYFDYVFTAYENFDFWSSRAYYYAAKAQLEMGNNLNAKNLLLFYLKTSKHKDTIIYNNSAALWSRIKLN